MNTELFVFEYDFLDFMFKNVYFDEMSIIILHNKKDCL
jgi:hypothetical protein